jgi:hypothetical protein
MTLIGSVKPPQPTRASPGNCWEPRPPSVIHCGVMIFAVKAALTIGGFSRTMGWLRRRLAAVSANAEADTSTLQATERAVALAGALYPGRALCLEQSLVLYYLLRRQGIPVTYCQGVQPHPFQAHAWVEYRGAPLNDVAEHARRFTRFPAVLP